MATKVLTSCYGIPWRDSGLSAIDGSNALHCYIWNKCILITFTTSSDSQLRKKYIAPDGKCFMWEHLLLTHLGVEVNWMQEENARTDEYIQGVSS